MMSLIDYLDHHHHCYYDDGDSDDDDDDDDDDDNDYQCYHDNCCFENCVVSCLMSLSSL